MEQLGPEQIDALLRRWLAKLHSCQQGRDSLENPCCGVPKFVEDTLGQFSSSVARRGACPLSRNRGASCRIQSNSRAAVSAARDAPQGRPSLVSTFVFARPPCAGMSAGAGRGRDSSYPLPPAQTRAGATNAHGSYLG